MIHATIRECWILARNRRLSGSSPDWTDEPTIHAIVVETIDVSPEHRRRGYCRDFIKRLCDEERFDMVVVEGVINPYLQAALTRWGWECDRDVMDFYWRKSA